MNETVFKKYNLKNALTVVIRDRTYRYFGGYFTVFLELVAAVPVKESYFNTKEEFEEALSLLGEKQKYRKELKKQGVYESNLEE